MMSTARIADAARTLLLLALIGFAVSVGSDMIARLRKAV